MLKFYLLILIDAIVFQPFRVIIGFAMRFLFKLPPVILPDKAPITPAELYDLAAKRYETLDRDKYGLDADSAKFLGMLAYAAPEGATAWVERTKVFKLCAPGGGLCRFLQQPYPEDSVPFSVDMLSGFLLALLRFLPTLTDAERKILGEVWNKTTFCGFPMLTANPAGKKKLFNRGHIYCPWWIIGSESVLTGLAWLFMGYKITGEKKYLAAYLVLKFLNLPTLLLACPDAQLWLGPVYAYSAHNTHSKALIFYTGLKLTGSIFFRHALRVAWRRHSVYNADIALLAGEFFGRGAYKENALALIADTMNKGRMPCPQTKRYVSLIKVLPEIVYRAEFIMPPVQRGADYVNERSPIKGEVLNDEYRRCRGLDVIFPAWLLQHNGYK